MMKVRQPLSYKNPQQNIPLFCTAKFQCLNKHVSEKSQDQNQIDINKQTLKQQSIQQYSFNNQDQKNDLILTLQALQSKNNDNQRIIQQLRQLHQKQMAKVKFLQCQNKYLIKKTYLQRKQLKTIKNNICDIYLTKQEEQKDTKQKIIKLSKGLQKIPSIISQIIGHKISIDLDVDQSDKTQQNFENKRHSFSLQKFKSSMSNLQSKQSQISQ